MYDIDKVLDGLDLDPTIHKVNLISIIQDEDIRKKIIDLLKKEYHVHQDLEEYEIPLKQVIRKLYFVICNQLKFDSLKWSISKELEDAWLLDNENEYKISTKEHLKLFGKNKHCNYNLLSSFFVQEWYTVHDIAQWITQKYNTDTKNLYFQSKKQLEYFLMKQRRLQILNERRKNYFLYLDQNQMMTMMMRMNYQRNRKTEIRDQDETFFSEWDIGKLIVPRIWR